METDEATQGATDAQLQDRQTRVEERLIANVKVCPVPSSPDLKRLNAAVLETRLSNDFYEAGLLQALSCYFDVTLHPGRKAGGVKPAPKDLHKRLMNPHRIGAESVEGVALLTGIGAVDDLVIIKAPRDPKNDGLLHEYFVSLTCLNPLRLRTPGFMYTFGAFRCSAPIIEGKKVVQWCTPKGPSVNYVIFEKISGRAFDDLVPTLSLREFLSYYIQVAINTKIGVETCSWTHYDLHAGNVLCREVKGGTGAGIGVGESIVDGTVEDPVGEFSADTWYAIPFSLVGDEMLYVRANRVATIIDYGRAHVKYQGRHFGFFDTGLREGDGLYPNVARPLYDMYKLLGFALYSCFNATRKSFTPKSAAARELVNALMPLFSFFRDVTGEDGELNEIAYISEIKEERETYYVLSVEIGPFEKQSSIQDLLAHIESNYPDEWAGLVTPAVADDELVLTCSGVVPADQPASCKTAGQEVKSLQFGLVKASETRHVNKAATQIVQEVKNSRGRLRDMERMHPPQALGSSVEYQDVTAASASAERLMYENYDALRAELDERAGELTASLKQEGALYTGLNYEPTVSSEPRENDQELRNLLGALERSRLSVMFALVKSFIANEFTISELDYAAGKGERTRRKIPLPNKLINTIVSEAATIDDILDSIRPLTSEGKVLRDSIRSTISLGL
jgi:hypothetical protein